MNVAGIPQDLIDLLDERAGRRHSRDGRVVNALAEILTRYETLRSAETAPRARPEGTPPMGSTITAHLAYGYDLGNLDDFRAAERDEFGGPAPDWHDGEGRPEFVVQLYDALYAAAGLPDEDNKDRRQSVAEQHYGVEVAFCGDTHQFTGWVLIVSGSEREACNADTLALDPFLLERTPIDEGWDGRLEAALAALGITPTRGGPCWLVFPSYG